MLKHPFVGVSKTDTGRRNPREFMRKRFVLRMGLFYNRGLPMGAHFQLEERDREIPQTNLETEETGICESFTDSQPTVAQTVQEMTRAGFSLL
jgi:hypothetical protein